MYDYERQKPNILTDEGQKMFLKIRDKTFHLLEQGGAARCEEMMSGCGGGSSWDMLACVDRMVELGEIREVTKRQEVAGQHRVFVRAR